MQRPCAPGGTRFSGGLESIISLACAKPMCSPRDLKRYCIALLPVHPPKPLGYTNEGERQSVPLKIKAGCRRRDVHRLQVFGAGRIGFQRGTVLSSNSEEWHHIPLARFFTQVPCLYTVFILRPNDASVVLLCPTQSPPPQASESLGKLRQPGKRDRRLASFGMKRACMQRG